MGKKKKRSRDGKSAVKRTEINGQKGNEREKDITVEKEREFPFGVSFSPVVCSCWLSPWGPVNDRY